MDPRSNTEFIKQYEKDRQDLYELGQGLASMKGITPSSVYVDGRFVTVRSDEAKGGYQPKESESIGLGSQMISGKHKTAKAQLKALRELEGKSEDIFKRIFHDAFDNNATPEILAQLHKEVSVIQSLITESVADLSLLAAEYDAKPELRQKLKAEEIDATITNFVKHLQTQVQNVMAAIESNQRTLRDSTGPSSSAAAAAAAATAPAPSRSAARGASAIGLKPIPPNLQGVFREVNSSKLNLCSHTVREDFLRDKSYKTPPPIISKSDFVSKKMAEHLMRRKKELACGIKYEKGDAITNMEGALHTFLTPVAKIKMTGDYCFSGGHNHVDFGRPPKSRDVVLSAAIHPDFEIGGQDEVVMRLIELKPEAVEGRPLPEDLEPLANRYRPYSTQFKEAMEGYDQALLGHMVHHLTAAGRLPALNEVEGSVMTQDQALQELERIIKDTAITQDIAAQLRGKFVNVNSHVVSLEALYNIYLNQVRNEISVLEAALPQGYVYTIDPPSFFAGQFGRGNVPILNRLQLLAFKELKPGMQNLMVIGFNDYGDKGAVALYQQVFPDKTVLPKIQLFQGPGGQYNFPAPYALVEHNNSDAFGQNIENESTTSKDGILGVFSDASHCLRRDRPDLMQFIV